MAITAPDAPGRGPQWSGLGAVAVSPDGKTIVTGGQNRTLYVLDAATLEVTRRHWIGTRIGALAFNKDGSTLVVEDDKDTLHFLRTATLREIKAVKSVGIITSSRPADLLVGARGDWRGASEILFLSLTDGSEKGTVALPDKILVGRLALSPDGKRLAVLSRPIRGGEKRVKRPKDLKGADAAEFAQKHDGRTSKLFIYGAPSRRLLKTHDLWYTSGHQWTTLLFDGETTIVFNFSGGNAKIGVDGKIKLFRVGDLAYGRGVSPDARMFATGSLRTGFLVRADDLTRKSFRIRAIKGWPEYFAGFTFHTDGSAYGVTGGFRLVKITRDAKVEKVVPVY